MYPTTIAEFLPFSYSLQADVCQKNLGEFFVASAIEQQVDKRGKGRKKMTSHFLQLDEF